MRKIDKIVAGVLLYYFAFVVVAWVAYFVTGGIPDTLVSVGLGGGVIELVATACIEILSNGRKKDETPAEDIKPDNPDSNTGDTSG